MVRLATRPRKAPRRVPVAAGPPNDAAELQSLLWQLGLVAHLAAVWWMATHVPYGVEIVDVIDLDDETARRLYAEAVQPIHAEAVASAWVDPPF